MIKEVKKIKQTWAYKYFHKQFKELSKEEKREYMALRKKETRKKGVYDKNYYIKNKSKRISASKKYYNEHKEELREIRKQKALKEGKKIKEKTLLYELFGDTHFYNLSPEEKRLYGRVKQKRYTNKLKNKNQIK